MSAIFGIWKINGEPVEEEHLHKMRDTLADYGRDGQDIFIDQSIGLGCCLSNFCINSHAGVPAYNVESGKTLLIADALIYNKADLSKKHGLGDKISTQAMLLEAYNKWGGDCPNYINGDFAFAVWEKQKKQLFIARDHLGVRPLYYFFDGSVFAFATDYRALFDLPFVGKQLDEVSLYANLSNTYHIDPEATCFEHIRRLPQAHVVCVGESGIHKNKYWSPGAGSKLIYKTEEEYTQALYNIVDDAIKLRVNSVSGKLGAELSGGLDSSVITILAGRELKKADKKLEELFSWSPPCELLDKQPKDERNLIEAVCRQEKLNCTYYDPRNLLDRGGIWQPGAASRSRICQRRIAPGIYGNVR